MISMEFSFIRIISLTTIVNMG